MQILAKGDEAAFRVLFARHGSLVFGYCMRILQGDRSVAEDICQNVWIKIIRSAPDYQGQGNFRAWLLTITRNASYEYFRKERRWVDQEEDELEAAH